MIVIKRRTHSTINVDREGDRDEEGHIQLLDADRDGDLYGDLDYDLDYDREGDLDEEGHIQLLDVDCEGDLLGVLDYDLDGDRDEEKGTS